MARLVALKPFTALLAGSPQQVLPGDVFDSTKFSPRDWTNLQSAAAAVANSLVDFTSPDPGLVAAQARAQELRLAGGSPAEAQDVMLDGYLLDKSSSVTTGTAVLVGSTIDVTVPAPPDGSDPVPVGSGVYATVTTPGGVPKLLSAVRLSATQIRISSPGNGYGALLESAGVQGVLVAGQVTLALANVAGDRLGVALVTPGGTPGVLSASRVDDSNVQVDSWLAGTGIEAADTSTVKAYNFGQAGQETSTVRWAVARPLGGAASIGVCPSPGTCSPSRRSAPSLSACPPWLTG